MPCPVRATRNLQYIDARDLANFVVRVAEETLPGPYHVAGPQPPVGFVEAIEAIARHVAPAGTTVTVVSPDRVLDANVADKLPLWGLGESANYIEALDSSLAISQGLDLRPLDDSVDDVLEWWGERAWPTRWLTSDEETQLLRR